MENKQIIKCENLIVGYNNLKVLPPLNFSVEEGDYIIIAGANGTGKTTLCKTLLRLQEQLSGTIEYLGGLKASEVGYLPQLSQIPEDFPASIQEIVLSGMAKELSLFGFYSKTQKELAKKSMELLSIYELREKSYRELSGGQRQRVLLARALCSTKKVLILDEPTTGLDSACISETYEIIEKLNKEQGITIIMISHDIENAIKYANKILLTGEKVTFESVEEYKRRKA